MNHSVNNQDGIERPGGELGAPKIDVPKSQPRNGHFFPKQIRGLFLPLLLAIGACSEPEDTNVQQQLILSSLKDIENYIKDKKVILFGEHHSINTKDAAMFISYLSALKKTGFTQIALELRIQDQKYIDEYASDPSDAAKKKLLSALNCYKDKQEFVEIIEAAVKRDLKIFCIDNRNPALDKRETGMSQFIEDRLKINPKIAVFIGNAHLTSSKNAKRSDGGTILTNALFNEYFQPLGSRLIEKYGKDNVGLMDLTGKCEDPSIFSCVR